MIDFESLSEEELYEVGKQLGQLSQNRPDISHRLILGFRDGMRDWGNIPDLGDIFWTLYRQGLHHVPSERLRIQFAALMGNPSGTGKN